MFSRCVRGNQSQNKLFMKLAPTGNAMLDLTAVATQMALSLMFKDVISIFNGKNMKGMFIPVLKSTSKVKSPKLKSDIEKVITEKSNRVIFPQYTTDVLVELKDIFYSMGSELSIYKKGEVGDIISEITGCNLTWDEKKVLEESKKYKTAKEWQSLSSGSYAAAKRLGIYDVCVQYFDTCQAYKDRKVRTTEELIEISKRYKDVSEWKENDESSYKYASGKKLLPLLTSHMVKNTRRKWTFETCKKDIGTKSKIEWIRSNASAYGAACSNNWIDELFPNEPKRKFKK
jgi:hypothetical protein